MRIKISLRKEKFTLPMAYQEILQGIIFAMLSRNELGTKYHDEGYRYNKKTFKCFVFSNILGKFSIMNKKIIFDEYFSFYIASQDEKFIQTIYQVLMNNKFLFFGKTPVEIVKIELIKERPFKGVRKITLETLSPVLIYSTTNDYSTYYKMSDAISKQYILQNIEDKTKAYGYPIDEIVFHIVNVNYEKRRMVEFKNCYYCCYSGELEVETNYDTLLFVLNCGLSSKGSAGFGMVKIKNEKDNLFISQW